MTSTETLEASRLPKDPFVCDWSDCENTNTQPAVIDIHDDEGELVDAWALTVCPEHVKRLIAIVKSGEN